jgi:hypothetical protein
VDCRDVLSSLVRLTQLHLHTSSDKAKRKRLGDRHSMPHAAVVDLGVSDLIASVESPADDLELPQAGYILVGWATVGFVAVEPPGAAQPEELCLLATDISPSSSYPSGPESEDLSFLAGATTQWWSEPDFGHLPNVLPADYFQDLSLQPAFPAFENISSVDSALFGVDPTTTPFADKMQTTDGASSSFWSDTTRCIVHLSLLFPLLTYGHRVDDHWDAFFKNVARGSNGVT